MLNLMERISLIFLIKFIIIKILNYLWLFKFINFSDFDFSFGWDVGCIKEGDCDYEIEVWVICGFNVILGVVEVFIIY